MPERVRRRILREILKAREETHRRTKFVRRQKLTGVVLALIALTAAMLLHRYF